MANPIYILHLSDWHIKDNDLDNNECLEAFVKTISRFLKIKGRKYLELICITGDMMDKNGSIYGGNHIKASNLINALKVKFYKKNYSKLFCVPGNHDVDFSKNYEFLKQECFVEKFKKKYFPNYLFIDKYHETLKKSFDNYVAFLKDIGADNENNPFNFFEIFSSGNFQISVSGFNSSWLCLKDEDWNNICSCKRDEGMISMGSSINEFIFKSANSNNCDFKISMSHHYPRLLNVFDLYKIQEYEKFKNNNTELLGGFEFENREQTVYNYLSKQDLVLNGHTHGKLFDHPFSTTSTFNVSKNRVMENVVSLTEVDIYRKFFIQYDLPIDNNRYTLKNVPKRIKVFEEDTFLENVRSTYSEEDMFMDNYYNNGRSKKSLNKKHFNQETGVLVKKYKKQIGKLDVFLKENILIEMNALNNIFNYFQ